MQWCLLVQYHLRQAMGSADPIRRARDASWQRNMEGALAERGQAQDSLIPQGSEAVEGGGGAPALPALLGQPGGVAAVPAQLFLATCQSVGIHH